MKRLYAAGHKKIHQFTVTEADLATFSAGQVHPVCATFTLAKEVEWASRLFVLDMAEANEEGIGTILNIEHRSPALLGQVVQIEATIASFTGNELICDYTATVNSRLVATGQTGQRILKKDTLRAVFASVIDK